MAKRASIIVRSVARPELHDALASLAAQSYPELEIVLVDATGGRHPPPPRTCGRHPVRFVGGAAPRSRPVAANAGVDAATGDYIGFLDDDDLLEPMHLATVANALQSNSDAVAAYTIAREVDAAGTILGRRDQSYSRLLLFEDCYMASNSVLFRRHALDSSRFDERFDICEDWDFWLQLATRSDFVFVQAETAVVRSTAGDSGTGRGGNRDLERYRHYASQLVAKWQTAYGKLAAEIAAASSRAQELFAAGRAREAEAAADAVLASYPYETAMLNIKGTMLALRGDFGGAIRCLGVAVRNEPDDIVSVFNLAQALEREGKADEAARAYRRALALVPAHPQARAGLARVEEGK